jgi:hypothetical protein
VSKLWEISDRIERAIVDNVDEDGVLSDEVSSTLDSLQMDAREKALAVAAYLKGLRAEASACDEVYKRGKKLLRQADGLEDYLSYHTEKAGLKGERIADGFSEIKWSKSTRTEVPDPRAVPPQFCGDPPPSKTLLKNAMHAKGTTELRTEAGYVFARLDTDQRLKVK